jgi:proteasome assembly chaperone 2
MSPVTQHPLSTRNESSIPFIPGGGLTRRFLSSLEGRLKEWYFFFLTLFQITRIKIFYIRSIPTATLLQFVVEGDNRADANLFAVAVAKVLGVDIHEWKQPSSWTQGLFGTVHDQSLYG